jgi:hypothetical protein
MGKCSNAFFSETTNMIKAKLYTNVHWMVLYKLHVFCSDMKFKMAATAGLSFMYSLALIIFVVSEKKAFEHFPIGSNVNLCIAVATIFHVFCSDMKFKMAATAGLSLTLDPMEKMFQNASSLKPLGQLKPNCPGMIIGRFSTNFMFFMPIGNPRWLPPQYID